MPGQASGILVLVLNGSHHPRPTIVCQRWQQCQSRLMASQCSAVGVAEIHPHSPECGTQSRKPVFNGPDFLMLTSPQALCSGSAAELGPRFVGGPETPSHRKEAHTYPLTREVTAQLVLWLLQVCGGPKGPIKIFVWDPWPKVYRSQPNRLREGFLNFQQFWVLVAK